MSHSPRLLLPLLLAGCGLAGCGLAGSASEDECKRLDRTLQREYDAMKTCEVAEDCGTILEGTGCSTECDRVVRLDADTTAFDKAMQDAFALECLLEFELRCDCPPTDGFVCEDGVCDWYYPQYGPGQGQSVTLDQGYSFSLDDIDCLGSPPQKLNIRPDTASPPNMSTFSSTAR